MRKGRVNDAGLVIKSRVNRQTGNEFLALSLRRLCPSMKASRLEKRAFREGVLRIGWQSWESVLFLGCSCFPLVLMGVVRGDCGGGWLFLVHGRAAKQLHGVVRRFARVHKLADRMSNTAAIQAQLIEAIFEVSRGTKAANGDGPGAVSPETRIVSEGRSNETVLLKGCRANVLVEVGEAGGIELNSLPMKACLTLATQMPLRSIAAEARQAVTSRSRAPSDCRHRPRRLRGRADDIILY
ncbi:hypothetical protein TRVL_05959 [Trypanosoma vivax]|nr:hypothetical protein TRVL_05959 [Trypanosoma vivax]